MIKKHVKSAVRQERVLLRLFATPGRDTFVAFCRSVPLTGYAMVSS
ncbi:MAG: hypothetical protein R3E72_11785 [Steroidobacteraceae bacterium]|jgi:hypothetical protein